jgi:hypothetical protein
MKQIIDPIEYPKTYGVKEKQISIQEPQLTVKFEALKLLNEAVMNINEALNCLDACKDLGGDNEVDDLAEALSWSITKDRNTLSRAILEAKELWVT